jgi:flagellin
LAISEVKVGTSSTTVSMGTSFSSLNALADAINEKASDVIAEVSSEGRIILSNTTGKDIVLDGAGLSAAGLEEDSNTAADGTNTYAGFLKFTNNNGSSDRIVFGKDADAGTAADLAILGLNEVNTSGAVQGGN